MTGLSLGRLQAASYNVYLKSVGGRLRATRFLLSRLQAASYFCCLFYRARGTLLQCVSKNCTRVPCARLKLQFILNLYEGVPKTLATLLGHATSRPINRFPLSRASALPQLNKNQSTSLNDSPNALIKLSISSSSVVNGKPN
ncbi:MAG: hypothetical protein ACI8SR_003456 [Oceanicoccus sp.]|jgi:hypothetical protein